MEYTQGESLAQLMRLNAGRARRISPAVACAVAADVLAGLHAAHEATDDRGRPIGIVHRDVSPDNVLVGADGSARVFDFGVAKAVGRLQVTREGQVKGTIAYMAPEQVRGGAVDRSADVYSVAVVLWEMLTGRKLFDGDRDADIVENILFGAVDAPAAVAPRRVARPFPQTGGSVPYGSRHGACPSRGRAPCVRLRSRRLGAVHRRRDAQDADRGHRSDRARVHRGPYRVADRPAGSLRRHEASPRPSGRSVGERPCRAVHTRLVCQPFDRGARLGKARRTRGELGMARNRQFNARALGDRELARDPAVAVAFAFGVSSALNHSGRQEHRTDTTPGEADRPPAAGGLRSTLYDRRRRHPPLQTEVPLSLHGAG